MHLAVLFLIVLFSYIFINHFIMQIGPIREGAENMSKCNSQAVIYENKGNIAVLDKTVKELVRKVQVAIPSIEKGIETNANKIKEIETESKNAVAEIKGKATSAADEADKITF